VTALLALTFSLVPLAAVSASWFARRMRRAQLGQRIREYGPKLHEAKGGTPTMGGVVILVLWALAVPILAAFRPVSLRELFVLFCGLSFGAIGLLDDLVSQRHRRSLGLRPTQKILFGTALSVVFFFAFRPVLGGGLLVPFSGLTLQPPAFARFVLVWGVFLAATNSVNLTDGLDGLASGAVLLALLGYLVAVPVLVGAVLPLAGILLGFLWVNGPPARLFLGDVGAFALGGALAGIALSSGTALVLPLFGGLFALEMASVILQVASLKLFGKRVFKISPLHHHFERAEGIDYPYLLPAVEWPEEKIVLRLWIVQAVFVALGILALWA
jgi:phospho-N-acetylmuramoyl-pentapeptide-transferase